MWVSLITMELFQQRSTAHAQRMSYQVARGTCSSRRRRRQTPRGSLPTRELRQRLEVRIKVKGRISLQRKRAIDFLSARTTSPNFTFLSFILRCGKVYKAQYQICSVEYYVFAYNIFPRNLLKHITHRERLPPPAAGDEGEALRLDGHARALHVLLDVPEEGNVNIFKQQ